MNPRLREFQMLWRRYCPTGDAAESRAERLAWLARLLGKCVDSSKQLSATELALAVRELRAAMRRGSNVVRMPHGAPAEFASLEQVWKIRQLEAWLGWASVPERLGKFLETRFHARRGEALTRSTAWRVIEALLHIAARAEGKTKTAIREELKQWRPAS